MSKSKENTSGEKFKSKIGGQAVIEGVMMRGIDKAAMACRLPSGEIDLEEWAIKGGKNAPFYRKIPFVRGVFVFITSMIDGYKCLSRSADKQMSAEQDDDEEPSKFEKWVDEKLGDKLMPIITTVSIILGLALAIALFMLLPSGISKLIDKFVVSLSPIAKNIIEGIIKIAIFIGYTSLTALMKDIRRTYEYHGAEHKTITCYEHGDELTVENVKKHCRFHPRCGTSFIFLVLFISIFVSTVFRVSWGNIFVRVLVKIALLPIVMGISYELIRLAGKYDNIVTRVISAPGLWIQRITTREPDGEEIECAIKALTACIPDDPEEDRL
ncbi:MAG: DUF1385 domain-containing protein [Ruminococcus sp.]|nr:DUF1385 domain-containing protein [Ruminococcus sp.]MBQ1904753.1 DUF1385 domain-containing protein [Ruminococcus sp.]MBQ3936360.1 DUF1385 domain-containing protein [Ruminococcus sp.]MBQ9868293.1 DUF1385 domain-containing protein [Ruminococcus sp.]MCR5480697.1 DUF1385 domain-containing protein [Ruminococcus sp.]